MKTTSQRQKILKDLKDGAKLTGIDALAKYGCFRLPARIGEIKKMGFEIHTEMINLRNGTHIARYYL